MAVVGIADSGIFPLDLYDEIICTVVPVIIMQNYFRPLRGLIDSQNICAVDEGFCSGDVVPIEGVVEKLIRGAEPQIKTEIFTYSI